MNKANFLDIFKNRNYLRLYFALVTSQMGSIIGLTAFMFYLLDRFGDQPHYATIAELMYSLPTLAIFFIVGVLADRMDRQKIAANSDWISAILTVVLMFAIGYGWMPLIFAILFLRSAVNKFFFPAESALVQGILRKDQYTTAAGLNQMTQSIFAIFGTGMGATAYWLFGIQGAILVDAFGFILSGLLIRSCKISEAVRLPNGPSKWSDIKLNMIINDFNSGVVYILKNSLLFSLIIGFFLFGIVNGGLSVMPIFILKYKLAPDFYEEAMVILSIIIGSGLLVGSILASVLAKKLKLYQLIILGIGIAGICTIGAAFVTNVWIYMAVMLVFALSLPLVNVALGGWLPQIVDSKMMGRVQGSISPLMMLAQSATLGLIAVGFPKYVAVETLFYGVGGCMLVVSIYYFIVLPKFADKPTKENLESSLQTEAIID